MITKHNNWSDSVIKEHFGLAVQKKGRGDGWRRNDTIHEGISDEYFSITKNPFQRFSHRGIHGTKRNYRIPTSHREL